MSDLLIAPAYAEIAALKRHFQLLNGSPEMLEFLMSPGVTGSGLQTLLASPVKLTAFQQLISSPSGAAAVAASSTAMTAVAASSTVMAAVLSSSTAMSAVLASSTAMSAVAASYNAMSAVAASSTAMAAVLNSATARRAVYDSDIAWDNIVGSATAKAALLASSTEHITNSTSHGHPLGSDVGVRTVLVQQKSSDYTYASHAGAKTDTYSIAVNVYVDRYVRVTGLTHRTSSASSPSYVKYIIMQ